MANRNTILALLTAFVLAAPAAYADNSSSSSSSSSSSNNGRTTTRNSDSNRNSDNNRNSSRDRRDDQDNARDALRRGKVMPLTAILESAFKRERGTVLEVELDTEDGVLTYRIELLTESGRKADMWINARSGEVLKVRYP